MMEYVMVNISYFLEMLMAQIYLGLIWGENICFKAFSWILFITNGIVLTCVDLGILPKIFILGVYILMFGYFYKKYEKSLKVNLTRFGMVFMLMWVSEIVSGVIVALLKQYVLKQCIGNDAKRDILVNGISLGIALFMNYTFGKKIKKNKNRLESNFIVKSIMFCSVPLFILFFAYFADEKFKIWYVILVFVFIIVLILCLLRLQKSEYQIKQKELELNINRVYGDLYEEVLNDIRRKQHDFQNQLAAVYSSHKVAASLEELVEMQKGYCNVIEDDNEYNFILMSCNEPVLAGFLYYKCRAFKEQAVKTDCDVHIDHWNGCMQLHELIEVLGILLDNAFEQELENAFADKRIGLRVMETEQAYKISVSNRIKDWSHIALDKLFETGYSTKGENRGLGLSRVKQICDKYKLEVEVLIRQGGEDEITFAINSNK